jgi:indole-3-glycerol phosphate synthase
MNLTQTILDKIIVAKRDRLLALKTNRSLEKLESDLAMLTTDHSGVSFFEALKSVKSYVNIIAEIKKASPSEEIFRDSFELSTIVQSYQKAEWVAAISVLTEQDYFKGSIENLRYVKEHNSNHKPILRKDFIFDTYQIVESKYIGADAYLLIACLFSIDELNILVNKGISIGIEPLVEVHTTEELEMVLQTKARCIGVNSRNLHTFKINNELHMLLKGLDDSYVRVAESGIDSPSYLKKLGGYIDGALVGGYFMKSDNITNALENLKVTKGMA